MPARDSEPIRRSIEVEYWVTDREGSLVEPGELTAVAAGVEREFVEPLLEIKTTPCESSRELRTELSMRIGAVLDRAAELGKKLVPLATPIHAEEIKDLPDDRTRVQTELIGEKFEFVRHCAGTHIHVEQQPDREVDQLNAFIALDPALALVNSSPYYQGEEIAPGARSKLYRWLAYEDMPHQGRLWPYVQSKREWNRRLERRYEEFRTAAVETGVNRQTVAANFEPESAVWTPVQFRETFGTVEWRSADTTIPSQVLRLTDQLVEIVEQVRTADVRIEGAVPDYAPERIVLPEFHEVLDTVETAIEDGLTDEVRAYLERLGFDPDAYEPITADLAGHGDLTIQDAREIRLEQAQRLEEDVDRRISAAGD